MEQTAPLSLDFVLNVPDSQLIKNLRHAKTLGLPNLEFNDELMDVPLVICGNGPSLAKTFRTIPKGAHVMALNGAYQFLLREQIVPDLFVMLDAQEGSAAHCRNPSPDTLHLIASQCDAKVFEELKDSKLFVWHLNTPTTHLVWGDDVPLVGAARTVGITAFVLAAAIGYRNITLLGYDSSFEGETRGAHYNPLNKDAATLPVWVGENKYITTPAMASQPLEFFSIFTRMCKQWPELTLDVRGDGLFYDFVTTNNNEGTSRELELAKYVEAYESHDYGMSYQRAEGILQLLKELRPTNDNYLDVSTGRGEAIEMARKLGYTAQGTETVPALCVNGIIRGVLPDIPILSKAYDVVSLFEVIEHLVPEDLEPALRELERLAKKHILISAAVTSCIFGGIELHPSAMPMEKWEELFKKVYGAERVIFKGSVGGSPVWRIDL